MLVFPLDFIGHRSKQSKRLKFNAMLAKNITLLRNKRKQVIFHGVNNKIKIKLNKNEAK